VNGRLTPRQRMVLAALADGLTYQQAAAGLDISINTLRSVLDAARFSMGLKGAEAVTSTRLLSVAVLSGQLALEPLDGPAPRLTPRMHDILVGLARGWTSARIAAELVLAEDTVKTHLLRMLRRMGARNRVHAVALGFRYGLLRMLEPVVLGRAA
jgi:DNA-binding NarL/FixJ family response regulator